MPTELEAKFAVDNHEPIRKRLAARSARPVARVIETNSIHDRPDGSFSRSGCGLRVRGLERLEGETASDTLTFKGPLQPGPFKQREELELPIADADAMRRLLEAIGFVEVLRFRKRRESWQLDDCRVELDELPHLGRFVEIEGPSDAAVQAAREALGLAAVAHISRSYVGMLIDLAPPDRAGPATFDFT